VRFFEVDRDFALRDEQGKRERVDGAQDNCGKKLINNKFRKSKVHRGTPASCTHERWVRHLFQNETHGEASVCFSHSALDIRS
jgi:hypothetical protein